MLLNGSQSFDLFNLHGPKTHYYYRCKGIRGAILKSNRTREKTNNYAVIELLNVIESITYRNYAKTRVIFLNESNGKRR